MALKFNTIKSSKIFLWTDTLSMYNTILLKLCIIITSCQVLLSRNLPKDKVVTNPKPTIVIYLN